MIINVSNKLVCSDVPLPLAACITDCLTIMNPRWLENERFGRWQGNTDKYLMFYEGFGDEMTLPRGFAYRLVNMCREQNVKFKVVDQRNELEEVDFAFNATLRPYQRAAVSDLLKSHFAVLNSPAGSGKTVMALAMIAERKQPSLIVVHTRELLEQWIDRCESFLSIPGEEIGRIGGGKRTLGEKITVAMVQTLVNCVREIAPHIGHLIVDECHRAPARTFTKAVTAFDAKYSLGLSATPYRRDKLTNLIYWHLGDEAHRIEESDLTEIGAILPAEIVYRKTGFKTLLDGSTDYPAVLQELTLDVERNELIVSDVAREANTGAGSCLVLSDRKQHCETMQTLLQKRGIRCDLLTGDMNRKDRRAVVDRLNTAESTVTVATGQLVGEGFDCKNLTTLFLTTPIRFDGRLIQYLGRVLRPAPGKDKAKIYDYIDHHVPVLYSAAGNRYRKVYSRAG